MFLSDGCKELEHEQFGERQIESVYLKLRHRHEMPHVNVMIL